MTKTKLSCWVCSHQEFDLFKSSDISGELNSLNFAITNFDYGKTGELQKCKNCGFIQCIDLENVTGFYEKLEDQGYEDSRKERKLQEKSLVKYFGKYKNKGKLLDIGAGSGIMVEAALEAGYDAKGIEPSRWLQQQAKKHNLPVLQGIFPHPEAPGPFDVVTFVDVIEHVTNPGELLSHIFKALSKDAILVLVTPDVNSIAARMLKFRWWHYRIAHIGYFNKKNLVQLLNGNGFEIIKISRPSWYFTLKYLGVRFLSFFPKFLQIQLPNFLDKIIVPVNLRDSLLVVCRKKNSND
jgi:2-polyprenyl-3-methyl-5-hydroxy-6-metoxy-1,4-benzoquinol methylase